MVTAKEGPPVEIPNIAQPGYLESYADPVFGSKVTRITGDPDTLIPNLDAKWDAVARHGVSPPVGLDAPLHAHTPKRRAMRQRESGCFT